MTDRKVAVFWDCISALDEAGMLRHVMIVGSWAEYLYRYHYGRGFEPNLKTHDIDAYYGNPFLEVDGAEKLREALGARGFVFYDNPGGGSSFFKEGVEVEFLTSAAGGSGFAEIPFTGVFAEKLPSMDILERMSVAAHGHEVFVPTPVSYIVHKLFINPERASDSKRIKDIEAVRSLVRFVSGSPDESELLRRCVAKLPEDRRARVLEVAARNGIRLP